MESFSQILEVKEEEDDTLRASERDSVGSLYSRGTKERFTTACLSIEPEGRRMVRVDPIFKRGALEKQSANAILMFA